MNRIFCRVFQGVFAPVNRLVNKSEQQVVAGEGSIERIPSILKEHNYKKPMIVTGPRLSKQDFFDKLTDSFDGNFVVFNEVKPDPSISQIETMVSIYNKNNCDSIVAIGGGSNMDAAKAMAARIKKPHKSLRQLGGLLKVGKGTPFMIAVPTTAGTGSETTVAAVVTDDNTSHKYAINDPALCPEVAILDPNLTIGLPNDLTAYTGMDALTHAVEAYLNKPYYNKETLELSKGAIKEIYTYLPAAYADGSDINAREHMLKASYDAGRAFTVACVGNIHAIAHTIGGLYHVHHGLACAMVMPYVLEEYAHTNPYELARLAEYLNITAPGDKTKEMQNGIDLKKPSKDSDLNKALAFIKSIKDMNKKYGIPEHLDCIKLEDIDKMSGWAEREANPVYPVPVIFNKEKFAEVIARIHG